ncbi:hypothetical protein C0J52_07098 [Blattella germanica]|nr:hypothetical protein C0J52_07098 [Blattella germanica]
MYSEYKGSLNQLIWKRYHKTLFASLTVATTFDVILVHNVRRIVFTLSVLNGIDKKRIDSANKYNKRRSLKRKEAEDLQGD